ncbi:MAG: hypothetical protein V2J51_11430 [Erythrobacter sp.]|jgi:hypothetical protein|nr:hypothetical protein [Erythrobacter sp.]
MDGEGEFLKCDAPGCEHHEPVERISAEHVGKPCPACGANLLTAEDWAQWEPLAAMWRVLKSIRPPIPAEQIGGYAKITTHLHGPRLSIAVEKIAQSEERS